MERGLLRRQIDRLRTVGLDEKSFGSGQDYVSVMTDLDPARVLEVVAGHDTESGRKLWQALPAEQREKVPAAAMDMSAGFAAATRRLNSKIQQLKANARGFRSFRNYRTRILFFCGKLDLTPKGPAFRFAQ